MSVDENQRCLTVEFQRCVEHVEKGGRGLEWEVHEAGLDGRLGPLIVGENYKETNSRSIGGSDWVVDVGELGTLGQGPRIEVGRWAA